MRIMEKFVYFCAGICKFLARKYFHDDNDINSMEFYTPQGKFSKKVRKQAVLVFSTEFLV